MLGTSVCAVLPTSLVTATALHSSSSQGHAGSSTRKRKHKAGQGTGL